MKLIFWITRLFHSWFGKPPTLKPEPTTVQAQELDFDKLVEQLSRMSDKAQATFLYRFTARLNPKVLKTLEFYTRKRLERDHHSDIGSNIRHIAGKAATTRNGIS